VVFDEKEDLLRRLWNRVIVAAVIIVVPVVAFCADTAWQAFIDTPDSCYQTEREDGDTVYLKAIGVCNGKPGRAVIHSKGNKVTVYIGGVLWKDVKPQPLGVPDVETALEKASRLAGSITLPTNKAEGEMVNMAGKVESYYRSPEFQGRLKSETEKIKGELSGDASVRFYPDSKTPSARAKLGNDERIYIFISSSMPLQTVRNYVASVARLGDPGIVMVMRGFVDGMAKIQPTVRFIGSVLQRDPYCNPIDGECEMLLSGLAVDPLLFRRYGIDRVPAVVYARGVKAEDVGLSEGDSKNTAISESHAAFGDASLEYLLDQIQRETGARSLKDLSGM
jgi:type-F conjugative transfer system pilin assembly protein TrbC